MAEIVNLRRVKKRLARTEDAQDAAANRAHHGRTRQQREAAAQDRAATDRILDAARLDRDSEARE